MTQTPTDADQLRSLADAFWEDVLEARPTLATTLGDRRYDDRLDDESASGVAAHVDRLDRAVAEARAIDPAGIGAMDRVTRQMLIDEATGQALALRTGLHEWTVDPLTGPTSRLLDLVEHQHVQTPDDGRAMVSRWRAIGPYLDQAAANLVAAVADGRVAAAAPVERLLASLAALEETPAESWRLAEPLAEAHDDWSRADLQRFRADLGAAIRDVAMPAFRRYRQTIEETIRPVARPGERAGIVHVPGGAEAYRDLARVHTTLDLEPETIHAIGLAEIERIDAEFVELGGRVLGTRDLGTTLAALRDDPTLRFETAEQVFDTAKRSLARATECVTDWFGRVPAAACVVLPVPSHSAEHQTVAYYWWPAVDGSRPGRYYINLYAPTTRPRYEAETLAFHEAVPGHHLQVAIAQELPGLPAFQRFLGSTAFQEGWGLYGERLSDEMGLYSSDFDRFGILSFDAWRAGRLVVDTGMHALGWTRQQAIDFLSAHTALAPNNIANEVDRYIMWPGQALAYKMGQLEIKRLRDEAEAALGPGFDIKAFHDLVLGAGAISLTALRGRVADWVAAGVAVRA